MLNLEAFRESGYNLMATLQRKVYFQSALCVVSDSAIHGKGCAFSIINHNINLH